MSRSSLLLSTAEINTLLQTAVARVGSSEGVFVALAEEVQDGAAVQHAGCRQPELIGHQLGDFHARSDKQARTPVGAEVIVPLKPSRCEISCCADLSRRVTHLGRHALVVRVRRRNDVSVVSLLDGHPAGRVRHVHGLAVTAVREPLASGGALLSCSAL